MLSRWLKICLCPWHLIQFENIVYCFQQNPLTRSCFAWKVNTRFYHACPATFPIRPRRQNAGHSSIPDGSIPPRSFLAPYDDSTSTRSSPSDPESATSD